MPNRTLRFLLPALLVLATILAYYPAIRWGGYIWDDDVHLTKNPVIFAADGLLSIWSKTTWRVQFYPMTFTTFWLQYRISGLDPLPYHLVNVLFHAANALLLWQLLRRLGLRSAFWVAAVFALHPVNVESVAWVAERKNVLMGFFILLSALAYWRFEGKFENPAAPRDWHFYALASAAFVAALLSKTVCCTFPAALAVILWWKRGKLILRDVLPLLPWLVFGLGLGWWTAHLEKAVVGSVGQAWNYSAFERTLIAGRAVWFYVGKFLWPADLAFSYPLWNIHEASLAAYAAPLAMVAAVGLLWFMRKRWGRGLFAAIAFFLVTISPALGFVDYYTMIYSLAADHYVYLAMIGLTLLLLEPIARMAWTRERLRLVSGALAVLLVVCGALTWQRCFAYQNQEMLWRDTVQKIPPRGWAASASASSCGERARGTPRCTNFRKRSSSILTASRRSMRSVRFFPIKAASMMPTPLFRRRFTRIRAAHSVREPRDPPCAATSIRRGRTTLSNGDFARPVQPRRAVAFCKSPGGRTSLRCRRRDVRRGDSAGSFQRAGAFGSGGMYCISGKNC